MSEDSSASLSKKKNFKLSPGDKAWVSDEDAKSDRAFRIVRVKEINKVESTVKGKHKDEKGTEITVFDETTYQTWTLQEGFF